MIYFCVTNAHSYTLQVYLEGWARLLRSRIQKITYDELAHLRDLKLGTWIFSDLERLSPAQLKLAACAAEQLQAAGCRVLNQPDKALRRYDLLRKLNEVGQNPFTVHKLATMQGSPRFPVFVRCDDDHDGACTDLLHTPEEMNKAIVDLTASGIEAHRLLVAEFCDTNTGDGLFRKYGSMRMADRIIPRHIVFSKKWMAKRADFVTDATVAEEAAFMRDNPYADDVMRIFQLANIDYGRMDFSILNGKVVVWEINTNPQILAPVGNIQPDRLPWQSRSSKMITETFESLDRTMEGSIRLNVPGEVAKAVGDKWHHGAVRLAGRAVHAVNSMRMMRPMKDRLKQSWRLMRSSAGLQARSET